MKLFITLSFLVAFSLNSWGNPSDALPAAENCWKDFVSVYKGTGHVESHQERVTLPMISHLRHSPLKHPSRTQMIASGINTATGDFLGRLSLTFECIDRDPRQFKVFMSKHDLYHDLMLPLVGPAALKAKGFTSDQYTHQKELAEVGRGSCAKDFSSCNYMIIGDAGVVLTQNFSNIVGAQTKKPKMLNTGKAYVLSGGAADDFATPAADWSQNLRKDPGCYGDWRGTYTSKKGAVDIGKSEPLAMELEIDVKASPDGRAAHAVYRGKNPADGSSLGEFTATFRCLNDDPRQFVVEMTRAHLATQVLEKNGFTAFDSDKKSQEKVIVGTGRCTDISLSNCSYTLDLRMKYGLLITQKSILAPSDTKPTFDLEWVVHGSRVYKGAKSKGLSR